MKWRVATGSCLLCGCGSAWTASTPPATPWHNSRRCTRSERWIARDYANNKQDSKHFARSYVIMCVRALAVAILLASLAACEAAPGKLSAGISPPPSPTSATATCPDPIKCSTPPPGWTPYLGPPCDATLTTADEIRAAAAQMHAIPGEPQAPYAQYGVPLLVHPMRAEDRDEWLVPISDGAGGASGVVAVSVRPDGRGCAGTSTGWSGLFPQISIDAARQRVAGPNDPVTMIEAVYLPFTRELPPGSDTNMVWRAVRQSGYEIFLFGSGDLYEGGFVRARIQESTPLRDERPGASARPGPSYRPTYAVGTAGEVLAGACTDAFVIDYLRYLRGETGGTRALVVDPRLDAPIRVLGLHKPYTVDLWIVPVRDGTGAIVSLIAIGDSDGGKGQALQARAWSGPFPRVSEEEAKRISSLGSDPGMSARLGWAEEYFLSPGGPTAVNWLVTRRSGSEVVVTENGAIVAAPK